VLLLKHDDNSYLSQTACFKYYYINTFRTSGPIRNDNERFKKKKVEWKDSYLRIAQDRKEEKGISF
jgi:hypothetical protein